MHVRGKVCPAFRELTWVGNTVSVFGHVIIQSEQQDPHGQGEQASQKTVENQVEEQDERWKDREEVWRRVFGPVLPLSEQQRLKSGWTVTETILSRGGNSFRCSPNRGDFWWDGCTFRSDWRLSSEQLLHPSSGGEWHFTNYALRTVLPPCSRSSTHTHEDKKCWDEPLSLLLYATLSPQPSLTISHNAPAWYTKERRERESHLTLTDMLMWAAMQLQWSIPLHSSTEAWAAGRLLQEPHHAGGPLHKCMAPSSSSSSSSAD